MNKILIALVVVFVAVVGYFVFFKDSAPVAYQTPTPTNNWKTYSNTQYGFEFKYPNGIATQEYNDQISDDQATRGVKLTAGNLEMNLSINSTVYIGGTPTKPISTEQKTFGQISAEKSVVFGYQILPDGTWVLSYYFENKGNKYEFNTFKDGVEGTNPIPKSTDDLMEQILSTLKFTK